MGRVGVMFPRDRFLAALSFIYLFAFCSLYVQLSGLYGDNGVLPVRLSTFKEPTSYLDFLSDPNLLRLSAILKLESYVLLELCVVLGCLFSFIMAFWTESRISPMFLGLWLLYFTAVKSGQVFLWFQWDIMLLEAGFLAIFLARFIGYSSNAAHNRIVMWLLRWLLFRLMFSAGVVKLTSGCPSWWGLKALHWHYQSQCIPTPVAWYFHHLPDWFHKFCVANTLIIEILLPFLFFVPLRGVRIFSFYSQILLQGLIILTGNYNFFNLLTIALCYSLLSDDDFRRNKKNNLCLAFLSDLISGVLVLSVCVAGCYLFQFTITPEFTVQSSVGFTKEQFGWFLATTIKYTIGAAVALYLIELLRSVVCALRAASDQRKFLELLGVVFVGIVGLALLFSSLIPFASLEETSVANLPPNVLQINRQLSSYHVTNSYGLFRRMTGVGGRPELVLEAAPAETGPWTEYHFRFKPGSLDRIPPVVAPHQPRLDWQMWFAALSVPERNPWFYNLVYRLLHQEPDVLALLDTSKLPRNPKFLRAHLYTYHYTDPGFAGTNWWHRDSKTEYLPVVSLSSPTLRAQVEKFGLIGKRRPRPMNPNPVSFALSRLRGIVGQPADVTPLLVVLLLLWISKKAFLSASY